MKIDVKIPHAEYPVFIETECISQLQEFIGNLGASSVFALIDENVSSLHIERLRSSLPEHCTRIVIPSGESSKSLTTLSGLYDQILGSRKLDRSSLILAIGGGVVGDLAGFLAATVMRGVRCIQVPTTLLAMVDSSVGGKTAINHAAGKNLIGAFHQPIAVFADLDFLSTLPKREYISGFAEVIKSAVVGFNELFGFLEKNKLALLKQDSASLQRVLADSVNFKADIVREDERETGRRAILNYGHTVGHVLESIYPEKYLHGEAVAMGMVAANWLAVAEDSLSPNDASDIEKLIKAFKLPTKLPKDLTEEQLLDGIRSDKKRAADEVNFVLPYCIGDAEAFPLTINEDLAFDLMRAKDA